MTKKGLNEPKRGNMRLKNNWDWSALKSGKSIIKRRKPTLIGYLVVGIPAFFVTLWTLFVLACTLLTVLVKVAIIPTLVILIIVYWTEIWSWLNRLIELVP